MRAAVPPPRLRVVVADDHPLTCQQLCSAVAGDPRLELVGHATDGAAAVGMVGRLVPDVLLLDLHMPGLNGLEVARRVRARWASVAVVLVSVHDDDAYRGAALAAGAAAWLPKAATDAEIADGVVAAGRAVAP